MRGGFSRTSFQTAARTQGPDAAGIRARASEGGSLSLFDFFFCLPSFLPCVGHGVRRSIWICRADLPTLSCTDSLVGPGWVLEQPWVEGNLLALRFWRFALQPGVLSWRGSGKGNGPLPAASRYRESTFGPHLFVVESALCSRKSPAFAWRRRRGGGAWRFVASFSALVPPASFFLAWKGGKR